MGQAKQAAHTPNWRKVDPKAVSGCSAVHIQSVLGDAQRDIVRLLDAHAKLLSALIELLAAEETKFPPGEAGQEAQDAWFARRVRARLEARAAIAAATGAQS